MYISKSECYLQITCPSYFKEYVDYKDGKFIARHDENGTKVNQTMYQYFYIMIKSCCFLF